MKYTHIKKKQVRYLLSDVLPYETPIFFSNRKLVSFLDKEMIHLGLEGDRLVFSYNGKSPALISRIICALLDNNGFSFDTCGVGKVYVSDTKRIPYYFEVPREGKENRKLSVIHPANQFAILSFFDKYKELILYYCNKSHFSIRFPSKVASWVFFQDKTHYISRIDSNEKDSIEEYAKEYESLRSFFSYQKYSNIYKFYDSEFYNKLESLFSSLTRIDISHFFDSIYTHSICWHIYGKDYSKENTFENKNRIDGCFGDLWDSIMQRMNNNETNGIVIGPEFSRVFAEVIAQKMDCEIEEKLNEKYRFGIDYHICRYVDDYFVFTNSEDTRTEIVKTIREVLSLYRFYINDAKTELMTLKPLMSDISSAKYQIESLIKQMRMKCEDELPKISYVSATAFIQGLKTILHQNKVTYSDVMNYTLALLERRIEQVIGFWNTHGEAENINPNDLSFYFLQIEKIVFFLMNNSSGVNVAIRVSRISLLIINCIKQNHRKHNRNSERFLWNQRLYDFIYSEITSFLKRKDFSPEASYLLVLARELGKGWYLPKDVILGYVNKEDASYFSIVSCLFYISGKKRYDVITDNLYEKSRIIISSKYKNHSERVLLLFDCLTYPYFSKTQKENLLNEYDSGFATKSVPTVFFINSIEKYDLGFTNWKSFNFAKELDMKKGQFVY